MELLKRWVISISFKATGLWVKLFNSKDFNVDNEPSEQKQLWGLLICIYNMFMTPSFNKETQQVTHHLLAGETTIPPPLLILLRDTGGGVYHSIHRARGGVNPEQISSLSQGQHRHRQPLTFTPVNLLSHHPCFKHITARCKLPESDTFHFGQ